MAGPGGSVEFRLARRRFAPGYVLLMEARALGPADRAVLTPREREVLRWVREGKTNDEIALILSCGVTSVKTHLKNLFRKLGVDNRTAAARMSEL
jgi:DNA-binding CsgD family transcriptional regulator